MGNTLQKQPKDNESKYRIMSNSPPVWTGSGSAPSLHRPRPLMSIRVKDAEGATQSQNSASEDINLQNAALTRS